MKETLLKTWPLFFGLGMMMIANGLQGTLLGIRAGIEDFSVLSIGFIMSAYYIGFLAGSAYVPALIARVGHIRVFAALASLASTTVLIHGLIIDELAWCVVRGLTGFAYAGLFLVVESWLNDAATNKSRGTILGLYMVITYVGMAIGQGLLNVADPDKMELFVMTSVLVSLALVPISLSRRPAPDFALNEKIKITTIWKRSPLGILGVTMTGVASAALFGIGPVYGAEIGLSTAAISGFMASFLIGSVVCQMPVAWMSDRMDRRKMIIILGFLSAAVSGLLLITNADNLWLLFGVFAMLGGACLPIYGQCISHVNDHLLPRQFVAASGTLLLLNGAGAAFGPLVVTGIMAVAGVNGFVAFLIVAFLAIGCFGVYRTFRAAPVPQENQGHTVLMPARGSGASIYTDDI